MARLGALCHARRRGAVIGTGAMATYPTHSGLCCASSPAPVPLHSHTGPNRSCIRLPQAKYQRAAPARLELATVLDSRWLTTTCKLKPEPSKHIGLVPPLPAPHPPTSSCLPRAASTALYLFSVLPHPSLSASPPTDPVSRVPAISQLKLKHPTGAGAPESSPGGVPSPPKPHTWSTRHCRTRRAQLPPGHWPFWTAEAHFVCLCTRLPQPPAPLRKPSTLVC